MPSASLGPRPRLPPHDDAAPPAWPDPVLSANVYCAAGLDPLIHEVIAPFALALKERDAEGTRYLWFLRYSCGGEHLKIRVHGPAGRRPWMKRRLGQAVRRHLAALGPESAPSPRAPKRVPAIDREDRQATGPAGRALLWTTYRRSPVCLGAPPLFADEAYLALFTASLGAACERVLRSFHPDEAGVFTPSCRQSALLEILLAGLAAAFPALAEWEDYLVYHRDWVARALTLGAGAGAGKAREILSRYEREAASLGGGMVTRLRAAVERHRAAAALAGTSAGPGGAWGRSLSALRAYLERFAGDPDYELDPFARGPLLPTLLKIFNAVANQLGIKALTEGLLHHVLLSVLREDAGNGHFVLLPGPRPVPASPAPESRPEPGRRFTFEQDYRWLDLVAASGPPAARWLADYRQRSGKVLAPHQRAVDLLRESELAGVERLLRTAEERRRELRVGSPALFHVLGRSHHAAWGYYHYCREDYASAVHRLARACASIRAALERERFLLPLAALGVDLLLRRAQIARAQRRWREMEGFIAAARDVMADRRPLCLLRGGVEIYHSTIGERLAEAPELGDRQQPGIRYLLDDRWRERVCEEAVGALYLLPALFIPYP